MTVTYQIKGWWGEKVAFDQRLSIVRCPNCEIPYGIPEEMRERAIRWGARVSIYCPNGHNWHFTSEETRAEALAAELQATRVAASTRQNDLLDRLNRSKKAHASTKGTLTKVRNRAEKGVCLHCHRSFANVARHMTTQHSEAAR